MQNKRSLYEHQRVRKSSCIDLAVRREAAREEDADTTAKEAGGMVTAATQTEPHGGKSEWSRTDEGECPTIYPKPHEMR